MLCRLVLAFSSPAADQPAVDHRRDRGAAARCHVGRRDLESPGRAGLAARARRRHRGGRRPRSARLRRSRWLRSARSPTRCSPAASSLVCLAGFMRLVGPPLLDAFPDRILNIHPSLLPAFPGLDAQRQALEHGVRVPGATVHFVNAELDAGPIVAAGGRAGSRRRHRRDAVRAHPGRGAPALSGSDSDGARRRLVSSRDGASSATR